MILNSDTRSLILRGTLLCLVTGCGNASRAEVGTPGKGSTASIVAAERVTAGAPVRKTLTRETVQPGWIEPFAQAPLVSRIQGYVSAVHVDLGDRVEAGQVLIEISAPELKDAVQQKQALLAQAEAQLRQSDAAIVAAKAVRRTAEARVASAEAGLVRAQGELDRWRGEFARLRELATRGSVTEKLVDETRNQLSSAEASLAEAQAGIHSAEAAVEEAIALVGQSEADRGAAEARKGIAQADLGYAQTMLEYTRIKAPFAGRIARRHVDPGYFVQPAGSGPSPLLSVVQTDTVRVFLDVPETEAAAVTSGPENADPVSITVQALGNRTFAGTVTRISAALDPANHSLRTEIDLDNADGLLRPGMYASVKIRLEQRENVLTLPASALVRMADGDYCCRVAQGLIQIQPVKVGLRVGDDCEIVSGVTEQDLIVLARAGSLVAGQTVEVIPPPSR